MKKQTIILVSLTLTVSLAVVFVLYFGTDQKMNLQYNSFDRTFIAEPFRGMDTLDIRFSSYYLAGSTSSHVYLGNTTAPAHLLAVNTSLTDTAHIQIRVDETPEYRSIKMTVDSPYFYMADGAIPFIYRGDLAGRRATSYMDDIYFTSAVPISGRSFAMVALNNMENTLEKKTAGNPEPEIFRDLLEEQGDGIFSTDGILHYNKESARLVYVYFYRNEYICMDTNFNLLKRGQTIDTISRVKITVGEIQSENSFNLSAPPLVVNSKSCVSGNHLYINSNLLAKNEDVKTFERQSVVDVYHLADHTYLFSFYIPPYRGHKIRFFTVVDNKTLVALCDRYIVAYKLNVSHFAERTAERLHITNPLDSPVLPVIAGLKTG